MTILSPDGKTKTHYDIRTKVLARVTDKGIQSIDTTKIKLFSVADLQRLSNLDNEAFEMMSEVQNELRV